MKPINLKMRAFISYAEETVIDFTKPNQNLFLITGDTGSGKSTIFDAIVFALYGEASSTDNKRDGAELQTDFVDKTITPCVELNFSDGGKNYKIRRIPRHRKKNKTKVESETVDLIMPDGTAYSGKKSEIDKKIEEIIGLTKSQFMQVGMIAQGEFMKLIRMDSKERKIIFRKIFNTQFYQTIIDELLRRKNLLSEEMTNFWTVCKNELGKIQTDNAEILQLRDKIVKNKNPDIADLEKILPMLKKNCTDLENKNSTAQKNYAELSKLRDEKFTAINQANLLIKSFDAKAQAEKILLELQAGEPEIQDAVKLREKIIAAYEIQPVFQNYIAAQKNQADTEKNLQAQEKNLPNLKKQAADAKFFSDSSKVNRDKIIAEFTTVSDRYNSAQKIFKQIDATKKQIQAQEKISTDAELAAKKIQAAQENFKQQVNENQKRATELENFPLLQEQWKNKVQLANELEVEFTKFANDKRENAKQIEDLQKKYAEVRKIFSAKSSEYQIKHNLFLDAQAGFIAQEKLRKGEPCPVCGSIEHPAPCKIADEHKNLTREFIDKLKAERDDLETKQTELAKLNEVAQEKSKILDAQNLQLREKMQLNIPNYRNPKNLADAKNLFVEWKLKLSAEGAKLEEQVSELIKIKKFLQESKVQEENFSTQIDAANKKLQAEQTKLTEIKTQLEEPEKNKTFNTLQEAKVAFDKISAEKLQAEKNHQQVESELKKLNDKVAEANTLIENYRKNLPTLQTEYQMRQSQYQNLLTEKNLSEVDWQEVTKKYSKSETEKLQIKIDNHRTKKATAKGSLKSAIEAIGNQVKPNIEHLQESFKIAEKNLSDAKAELDNLKDIFRANNSTYKALEPKIVERSKIAKNFAQIENLHSRLAGKITGSRMDIETFVQRYYLARILNAANYHFRKMSGGQFELRMTKIENAGQGANRGLDLMVLSTVTGQEREVQTLSGGESFMAALSLALGTADKIQENSSAINLDMMFIDEGFGTLDDNSRDQAIKVLQNLSGDKLIAIISHVAELKQKVENKLLVTKDEQGSKIKWQIS